MLISALEDNIPVIFLERRWLYWQEGHISKKYYKIPLGKANIFKKRKRYCNY
jgi:pyruvate dehydrogenase E1 component beta subunit